MRKKTKTTEAKAKEKTKARGIFGRISSRMRDRKADKPSIRAYAVYKASRAGSVTGEPLYFSPTKAQALEAISRLVQLNHCEHYSLWCAIKGKTPEFPGGSWAEYLAQIYPDGDISDEADVYAVASLDLTPSDVATFLRMLSSAQPLILSGEPDEEIIAGIASPSIPKACKADAKAAERARRIKGGEDETPKA